MSASPRRKKRGGQREPSPHHSRHRQRRAPRGHRAGAPDACRFPAAPAWLDRHASRLRARRVRRLHDFARRAFRALLPHARGAGRRPRHPDRRGHRTRRRHLASVAAGVSRTSRPAMRLLHAGHIDDADRILARQSKSDRRRGAHWPFRQFVPLHRLSEHRHRHARCRQALARAVMPIRFDDIGNRLKAFRLGSGLAAEEIAHKLGISRTALYRFEKGELAKIETLENLAELLKVSVPTLLGVGVEYVASAVSYFERMRQIEETAEHIIVLAGPISYVLASDAFDRALGDILRESVPDAVPLRGRALAQIDELMEVLRQRKDTSRRRRPAIVNLIAAAEMERFLRNG